MSLMHLVFVAVGIAIAVLYLSRWRSHTFERVLVILLGVATAVLAIGPHWAHVAARWFGMNRGADLLFGLSLACLGIFCLLLYTHVRRLEARLTALVRAEALAHAQVSGPSRRTPIDRVASPNARIQTGTSNPV